MKTIFTYVYIEKNFFSKTSRSITIEFGINHPWVQGILNCSNKGPGPLQKGGDKSQMCKNRVGLFKYFLLLNHCTIKAQVYMSAS